MALSCMIGKVSSPIIKAQFLKNLTYRLAKPNGAVYISQFSFHSKLTSDYQPKELCDPKKYIQLSASVVNATKGFSTSSVRSSKAHDHGKIWGFERLMSILMLPLVPAALMIPCQPLDTALAILIVLHNHFGLKAVIVDYVRPILFGNLAPKLLLALIFISSVTFLGLLKVIYFDVGLANAVISVLKN